MILGLCLVSVAALVWLITAMPAKPVRRTPDVPSPRAAQATRERVNAHPERATRPDLARVLRETVSAADAERTLSRAAERGLPMPMLWTWSERYGAERLVLAIDAEVAERSMQRHLQNGTVPDWTAMGILAALAQDTTAGMPVDELLDPDAAPSVDLSIHDLTDWSVGLEDGTPQLDLSGFGKLPPIAGPAHLSAPSREWDPEEVSSSGHPPLPPREDPPRPRPGDRGPWPMAS
ncbi:hypothetical protein [Nocardioides mangrovi]|uniref:Secreted protein n=1 Tax=Nocardioides mangrovi TaxID=2874580 RepID=A0ABS7UG46_9ACTN|nr:hypothetical protein [Nocardioides mangrovi]MBZ5740003.1 hypothetical protein [Nocardioides mangrovi]MBZ5740826.1 hypothetical protein [Nocardioides mangrovi]